MASHKQGNPAAQLLKRIALLRYVDGVMLPSIGLGQGPVLSLQEDREKQAYLTGQLDSIPGVNAPYPEPTTTVEQRQWNTTLRRALKACASLLKVSCLPASHVMVLDRVYARLAGFFSRPGVCACSVPAFPKECAEDKDASHAIFMVYASRKSSDSDEASSESSDDSDASNIDEKNLFMVDFWISYDTSGITAATPNPPVARELTVAQRNSDAALDLAVGRWLTVCPKLIPASTPHAAEREAADVVFDRVKFTDGNLVIREVGQLCQPVMAFPVLGNVASAKAFFRKASSKWDAIEWLVYKKLY